MKDDARNVDPARPAITSITTRRSFVAITSFGAVSLYAFWAALGAAPLRFWAAGGSADGGVESAGGGHEGHGTAIGGDSEAFQQAVETFIADHGQADGSVLVEPLVPGSMTGATTPPDHAHTGAHDMAGMAQGAESTIDQAGPAQPLDVFVLAQQWSFEPTWLKLRVGVPYRFKFMAVDAPHGASLQLGSASQIIRLPKGVLVERELSFTRAGTYLLYCTIYCGEGRQFMSGKLEVA